MKNILSIIFMMLISLAKVTAGTDFKIHICKNHNVIVLTRIIGGLEEVILSSPCSMGKDKTPVGSYTVSGKNKHGYSKKFGSYMSDALALDGHSDEEVKKGLNIHQGDTADTSHGCIRCPRWTALKLFQIVPEGTEVIIEEEFSGDLLKKYNFKQAMIWVKPGVWKKSTVAGIMQHLNPHPVNPGSMEPKFDIDLNGLGLIVGKQAAKSGWFNDLQKLGKVDERIKTYTAGLSDGEYGMIRYFDTNKQTVGYLFDGGDYFLWYPIAQVDEALAKIGIHRKKK